MSRSLALSDGTTPVVEANVLQISTPVGTAKGFQIELLNNQSSGDTKKGIVVEAIQLLKPDAVFTKLEHKFDIDSTRYLTYCKLYRTR